MIPGQDSANNILNLSQFIGKDDKLMTYLHNLNSVELAEEIMRNGFNFENHLLNTTDNISPEDLVEVTYFMNIRKAYGNITLIIQINNELIQSINTKLIQTRSHFSEALTKTAPRNGPNELFVYTLPEQFIMGYFNHFKSLGVNNPDFDPYFISKRFEDNIQMILKNKYGADIS